MNTPRRLFLKNGAVALATIGASSLTPQFLPRMGMAAESSRRANSSKANSRKVLVCVFQRGAADGLSMVVPHGDPYYYKYRHEIALARPKRGGAEGSALDLERLLRLASGAGCVAPLYKAGHLAVVHACGSPNSSRSHFDMQDFMESGVSDDKSIHTGWLNRMLQAKAESDATSFCAVAMTTLVPRTLQGDVEALAVRDLATFGIGSAGSLASSGNLSAGFEGMYDGAVDSVLHGAGKESFNAIAMLKKANPSQYAPANKAVYPAGPFGKAMLQVAHSIKANVGLEVAFVELEGWDTHNNQGGANGQLAGRLHDLSQAIAAFHADLGDRMDDVLLLTMSEFGRAARQNGGRGTDHGHGTCFFALGGGVNGGRVLGKWPGLRAPRSCSKKGTWP